MFLLDRTSYLRFWVLPSHFIGLYLYFLSSFVDIIVTHFPCFVNTFLLFSSISLFFSVFSSIFYIFTVFIFNFMLCNVWFFSYKMLGSKDAIQIVPYFVLPQFYPIFAYCKADAPLLCSYRGGSLSHKTTPVQAHRDFRLLTLAS